MLILFPKIVTTQKHVLLLLLFGFGLFLARVLIPAAQGVQREESCLIETQIFSGGGECGE